MQEMLLVFACCSVIWNYTIPQRFMRYEHGDVLCGRRGIRLALLKLARQAGADVARNITLALIFLAWIALSSYFIAISASFQAIGLRTVAILTATLGTIALWQDMTYAYRNFTEWCYNQEDSIILVCKGCWELILAGLVLVNIFFFS